MSRITDELSKYGCDMNTTLERFLGDEDFYEKCLIEMLGDSSFRELGEALEQKNVKAAFESAHTLKGLDRKSTRLNSSHMPKSRMPSSA